MKTNEVIYIDGQAINKNVAKYSPEMLEVLEQLILETSHALPNSKGFKSAKEIIKKIKL